jgi:hypothetical protein
MLTELDGLQKSDESVYGSMEVSFTIQTRSESGDEVIERSYTFGHADEWDKWTFREFEEKRANDNGSITERNWRRTRHILWNDIQESRSIDVPPEVGEKLKEAIGADSVTVQIPRGGLSDSWYETVATYE